MSVRMGPSRDLTAQVHRIICTTIAQYYVNQTVKRGAERHHVQPGSVTFLQRFGGSLNANLHYHLIAIEGVFVDRKEQNLKPRFIKGEPPSDVDVAEVVQKISRRVIRKLRHLGYLEAGIDVPVATGYDPLLDTEPELARTMAASVKQRIAFGERAGEKVRHEDRVSSPRLAITILVLTWRHAPFAAVVHCVSLPPFFRHCVGGGSLATFTRESVMTRILRHLKLASVPPPIAPARRRQEILAFD